MTTITPLRGPMLNPRVTRLVRPSGTVQLGWDPERALLLESTTLDTATVLAFLHLLDGLQSRPQILWRAGELGIAPADTEALLALIDSAGLLLVPHRPEGRVREIVVHGTGPLGDAVATGLRTAGIRPGRTRDLRPGAATPAPACDLMVLTDTLMVDPGLSVELVLRRIPHLPVRVRDGVGVVGPLVLPGRTSCLRCADLIRAGLDADWPHLAAQLQNRVGHASPAGIAATAALALTELEVIMACGPRTPDILDATLELDLDSHELRRRPWPAHADCGCRTLTSEDTDNGGTTR